jgi:hypothetical protein
VPPPAGKGTTNVTGLVGQADWAQPPRLTVASVAAEDRNTVRREISGLKCVIWSPVYKKWPKAW